MAIHRLRQEKHEAPEGKGRVLDMPGRRTPFGTNIVLAVCALGGALCLAGVGVVWWLLPDEAVLHRLRVGYSPEPPFSFRLPDGTASGEAPTVARTALDRAGVHSIEWIQTECGLLIPELLAGHIDMIASGVFVTPEREQLVRFSRPTLALRQALLVRRGNPNRIRRYEDFASRTSLKLCVLDASVERSLAKRLGIPPERVIPVPDEQTALAAIRAGSADALALNEPSLQRLAESPLARDMEAAAPFFEPLIDGKPVRGLSAFAFRPDDEDLRRRVDAALAVLIGTPEHLSLIARFKFGAADVPGAAERERVNTAWKEPPTR